MSIVFGLALMIAQLADQTLSNEIHILHRKQDQLSEEMLDLVRTRRKSGMQIHLRLVESGDNKTFAELLRPIAYPCAIVYEVERKPLPLDVAKETEKEKEKRMAAAAAYAKLSRVEISGKTYVEITRTATKDVGDLAKVLDVHGKVTAGESVTPEK